MNFAYNTPLAELHFGWVKTWQKYFNNAQLNDWIDENVRHSLSEIFYT